jgi:hypothetical protein
VDSAILSEIAVSTRLFRIFYAAAWASPTKLDLKLPLPATVEKDKTFIIVGKVTADDELIQIPSELAGGHTRRNW